MNINFNLLIEDKGRKTKHPVTIKDVGYIIIDNNWIKFGRDAKHPDTEDWAIPRKGTSAKVIAWEEET